MTSRSCAKCHGRMAEGFIKVELYGAGESESMGGRPA